MDFYYMSDSPPCRAVMMTAKALGIKLNLKVCNLMTGEHLKPEFLKINPQHVIPTLVDNGFALWESRVIMIYLVEKYGKDDDSLYPECPKKRAIINQRLLFDMGTLYQCFSDYYYPQIFEFTNMKLPPVPENFKKMEKAMGLLNTFLQESKFVAGDTLTLADISLLATVSCYERTAKFDISKYPNVVRWYKLCNEVVPGVDINQKGADEMRQYFVNL